MGRPTYEQLAATVRRVAHWAESGDGEFDPDLPSVIEQAAALDGPVFVDASRRISDVIRVWAADHNCTDLTYLANENGKGPGLRYSLAASLVTNLKEFKS